MQFLSQTLVEIVTETERTAELFISQHRGLFAEGRYFRFNVQQDFKTWAYSSTRKKVLSGPLQTATWFR